MMVRKINLRALWCAAGCGVIMLACLRTAHAQPHPGDAVDRARFGLLGAADFNDHSANFQQLPGVPSCCPRYEQGTGIGPSFGALAEFPVTHSFAMDFRATYVSSSATLSTTEPTVVEVNDAAVNGAFQHTVNASLASIGIEPMAVYRLFGGLRMQMGVHAGLVITKNYNQQEEIIEPTSTGTFAGGSRVRNVYAGVIPGAASFAAMLLGGVRYELPMNTSGTLTLAPEIMVAYALTPVASGLAWRANAVRAGVALLFQPSGETPTSAPPIPSPPPADAQKQISATVPPTALQNTPPQKPALTAEISASGVDSLGVEFHGVTIRVEEFIGTNMRPLLPYIFFDDNSADIPGRYARIAVPDADRFSINALHATETVSMYRNILNIIGRRLHDTPRASVTIVGCNADRGSEKNNLDLSSQRAGNVRNYLRDVWRIDSARMTITARNLPETPSSPDSLYGAEENRRVEFQCTTAGILEEVTTHDTLRTATPPIVRFRDTIRADAGLAEWTIAASQNEKTLKTFHRSGNAPGVVDWNIDAEKESIPHAPLPIHTTLTVTDDSGVTLTASAAPLPVNQITIERKREHRIADRTIDDYSLILFDFDKAELSSFNKRLTRYIVDHISPSSTVHVDGYCDSHGDLNRNAVLSQERANAVAQALGITAAFAVGHHDTTILFPNDTPEGRFYCRTVTVRVETPVVQ